MKRDKKIKNKIEFEKIFEIIKIKQVITDRKDIKNCVVNSSEDVVEIIRNEIADDDREVFFVMALNYKNSIIAIHRCHIGSVNVSLVHPREVFKTAILNNASSIIVAHQHLSGDIVPSREDLEITKRLKESGEILGIELMDHLIVSSTSFHSLFRNSNLFM